MRTFKALLFASMVFVGVHAASGEAGALDKAQCDTLRTANNEQMAVIKAFAVAIAKKQTELLEGLSDGLSKGDVSESNKKLDEKMRYLDDFLAALKQGNPETMKKARLIIDMVCKE